jgi:hypothetical protein
MIPSVKKANPAECNGRHWGNMPAGMVGVFGMVGYIGSGVGD